MGNNLTRSLISSSLDSKVWDQGLLLCANPCNPTDTVYRSVILLFHQTEHTVLGLQVNRVVPNINLGRIFSNLGFDLDYQLSNDQVYYGGGLGTNRMHFIHSLDWFASGTVVLSNDLGITSDLSIVSALAGGEGPKRYRACAGNWRWDVDTLYDQIYNLDLEHEVQEHLWEIVPMDSALIFDHHDHAQWLSALQASAKNQSRNWMC